MSQRMAKPTKWKVRPAKIQISLGTRPVWSDSSLSTWKNLWSLATYWAHSEDSDQTGRMPRLIWVFVGSTCHFVGFVVRLLKSLLHMILIAMYFTVSCSFVHVIQMNHRLNQSLPYKDSGMWSLICLQRGLHSEHLKFQNIGHCNSLHCRIYLL